MHFTNVKFATITVAIISIICHVCVLAAPAADLDASEPLTSHHIRVRSTEVKEGGKEKEDEYYDEDEEEEDDDEEENSDEGMETVTKIKIRVGWSADENDMYVDNPLQAARMWGILSGCEGEDFISIKEGDDPPPSDSGPIFIPFSTQSPEQVQEVSSQEPVDTANTQRDPNHDHMLLLDNLKDSYNMKNRHLGDAHDMMRNALFGQKSYDGMTDDPEYTENTTPTIPTTVTAVVPQNRGQGKKSLWSIGPIDLEPKTTPDYNRLIMVAAFGRMFGVEA